MGVAGTLLTVTIQYNTVQYYSLRKLSGCSLTRIKQ